MKHFELDSHMVTVRGVFYPTGHVLMMLPDQGAAQQAAESIKKSGTPEHQISLLPPEIVLGPIARTIGESDMPLPSPGFEGEMVRHLISRARQGEWGVLVNAPDSACSDRVMEAVKGLPVSMAERYRRLVIEDLESH